MWALFLEACRTHAGLPVTASESFYELARSLIISKG